MRVALGNVCCDVSVFFEYGGRYEGSAYVLYIDVVVYYYGVRS